MSKSKKICFFYWKEVIQIATTGIWKIDQRLDNVIDSIDLLIDFTNKESALNNINL